MEDGGRVEWKMEGELSGRWREGWVEDGGRVEWKMEGGLSGRWREG